MRVGFEWGPLLWTILHTMAEWSDRKDIVYRWKRVLELTAVTIPCELCRKHMQDYLRSHSIFIRPPDTAPTAIIYRGRHPPRGVVPPTIKGWTPAKGMDVKHAIRKGLWKFHNHVNASLSVPELTEEDAYAMYISDSRSIGGTTIREALGKLDLLWKPHVRPSYKEWHIELLALLALIESGSF